MVKVNGRGKVLMKIWFSLKSLVSKFIGSSCKQYMYDFGIFVHFGIENYWLLRLLANC